MDINIESSCRICLQFADLEDTLFEMQYDGEKFFSILKLMYPIEIYENDFLPQKICSVCQSNTITAYKQYKLCLETDKNLRVMLNPGKEPSENEDTKINIHDHNFMINQFLETKYEPGPGVEEEENECDEEDEEEDIKEKIEGSDKLDSDKFCNMEEDEEEMEDQKGSIKRIREKKYICTFCLKAFVAPSKLKRHLKIHMKDIMSEEELNKLVVKMDDLKETSASEEKDDNKTQDPDFVVDPQKPTSTSLVKKVRPKKHACPECFKAFEKPSKLKRHMNVHNSNKKPFECVKCHQRFVTLASLLRHDVMHSDLVESTTTKLDEERKHVCMICQREFQSQESVSSHLKTHKEEMGNIQFNCDLCPKQFKKISQLTRHSKTHIENKNYKCNICQKLYASGSHLIDHLNRHKGIKPHTCPVCDKAFQQSCTLKDHMRTHSDDKPFLCSECGKSFNNSSNLRQHVLRHTGIRPFECHLCPAKFNCKGGLGSHMLTHTKMKPHICDVCGSGFTKGYSLTKHKRLHTGERPYICEVCGMKFNSSDHVKRHMRTHTGERPYACKYCDRTYAQSNDLVKHLRTHVGENTYKCEIDNCGEAFRLQSQLRDHWTTHYKNQPEVSENLPEIPDVVDLSSNNQTKSQSFHIKSEKVPPIVIQNEQMEPSGNNIEIN